MSQKPNISEQETNQFLKEILSNKASDLKLLSGGEWSQAYSFVLNDKKYVLRWCKSSETFEKDAFAARFSNDKMPIPKLLHLGKKFDTYYAVSEFATGNFIEKLSFSELKDTLPALFELLDSLRNTDNSKTSGYGGWDKDGKGGFKSWKEYLMDVGNDSKKSITHGWYKNLLNSELGTESFDKLYLKLRQLTDFCPEVRELIHSDLLNYNLIVKDNKISAVIDWQCSLYGDSLYDIAWFAFYEPWYPQFEKLKLSQKLISHYKAHSTNKENIKERLICYQINIGLGSIVYNAFKKDWKEARDAELRTLKVVSTSSIL